MIDVLYFSDKQVKQKLFERVKHAKKLTLVTVLPPHRAAAKAKTLEPFATLEHDFGDALDQVLVVDEGSVAGMWRDPVVDLADELHDDNKAAYAAARGYLFVQDGQPKATVKKTNDPDEDLERLEKTLERLMLKRPAARAPKKPAPPAQKKASSRRDQAARTIETPVPTGSTDPWVVLGLDAGASLEDARKAWKALIVQYHPDKVAHLAPEFRALAEEKTRQLMTAWEQLRGTLE